jgi:hypothetical protein
MIILVVGARRRPENLLRDCSYGAISIPTATVTDETMAMSSPCLQGMSPRFSGAAPRLFPSLLRYFLFHELRENGV